MNEFDDPKFRAHYTDIRSNMRQDKVGGVYVWSKDGVGAQADAALTPQEKIAQEKRDDELTLKTEVRDPQCWCAACFRPAYTWVREVQFDLRGDRAGANQAIASSRDYAGPVPGFCRGHEVIGAKQLAEAVYHMRDEFKWGLTPLRWWVVFTDDTKQGGGIQQLNLGPGYDVVEDYSPGA